MKVKIIRIYRLDLKGTNPYSWLKQFKELEAKEHIEPHQEFATEDKPKGWLKQFGRQLKGK